LYFRVLASGYGSLRGTRQVRKIRRERIFMRLSEANPKGESQGWEE